MNRPPHKPSRAFLAPGTQVRLIDENGQAAGLVTLEEAKNAAQGKGLDLIEVSGHTSPPVYKIADYGKLLYNEKKKNVELKKKQQSGTLKEIQLRPSIQGHDYQVKLSRAQGFLQNRDKVKIVLRFRGREMAFMEAGKKTIQKMVDDLLPLARVDMEPKLDGRRILAVLSPLKASAKSSG